MNVSYIIDTQNTAFKYNYHLRSDSVARWYVFSSVCLWVRVSRCLLVEAINLEPLHYIF